MRLSQFIDTLDLNRYEKEVVLYLASVPHADANRIYRKTKVPKGRIYSVMNSLAEKEFVKIIPTSPKSYTIEDIKESLSNYIARKKAEQDEKLKMIDEIETAPKGFSLDRNAPSVYTFTGREDHLNALLSLRNRTRKEHIQVAPLFEGTFASNLSLYKALKRGVKVRLITTKVTSKNRKNIQECIRLGAKVRKIDEHLVNFLISDSKEFIMGLDDFTNREERLNIYSRNKALLLVLKDYFEKLWKKSRSVN